jgi:membrane protein required for colicin V production
VSFNWADWVILGIVVVSSLFGLMRGLIKEALSVANWIIALLIAATFRDPLASLLVNHIETPSLRKIAAFSSLFFVTLMIGALVNYLIGEVIKMSGLSAMNRILGMFFGLLRGFVVVMALLLLVPPIISIDEDLWWSESTLIPGFLAFEDWARASAAELATWLRQLFNTA